jgi:hypothetical protein
MTMQEKISRELVARSKACERHVLLVAEHPTNPEIGFGIALLAPDCLIMSYCGGEQSPVFEISLN